MNTILEEIFRTGSVHDAEGNRRTLRSNLSRREGTAIYDLIRGDSSIEKTLEIGCAYGISSLFICEALQGRPNARHTILDPYQKDWKGIGILNLRRAGFDCFRFVESPSEYFLPALAEKEKGRYDFILIDGWHTFDHVMLDFFYSNLLLRVGGYLAIDDASLPAISKAVDYILTYPAYRQHCEVRETAGFGAIAAGLLSRLIPKKAGKALLPGKASGALYRNPSFIVLEKTAEDNRRWDWYEDF